MNGLVQIANLTIFDTAILAHYNILQIRDIVKLTAILLHTTCPKTL